MPDFIRRAVRSFVQAFLGALITSGVLSSAAESGVVDWSLWKKSAVACLAAGVVALITAVQNWLEDVGAVPAVYKAQASSGAEPITVDPATPNLEWPEDE